jgi:hypothetical protein
LIVKQVVTVSQPGAGRWPPHRAPDTLGFAGFRCDARVDDHPAQHNAQMPLRHAQSLASEFERIEQART